MASCLRPVYLGLITGCVAPDQSGNVTLEESAQQKYEHVLSSRTQNASAQ